MDVMLPTVITELQEQEEERDQRIEPLLLVHVPKNVYTEHFARLTNFRLYTYRWVRM